MTAMAAW